MNGVLAELWQRSPLTWGVRALLALLVAGIGYIAVTQSLALTLAKQDIARAHHFAPHNSQLLAELSRKQLIEKAADFNNNLDHPNAAMQHEFDALEVMSKRALARDATAIPAITTLGILAELHGDHTLAERWFNYSQHLSRRDLITQLWLIENAVAQGEIPEALRHYDIALRANRGAEDLLFPVLTAASGDNKIAPELIQLLRTKPPWINHFIAYAARNTKDTAATAKLFLALHNAGVTVSEYPSASLINRLVAGKQFDTAWNYYSAIRPNVDRQRSRNPKFAHTYDPPSIFDWVMTSSDSGLVASIQASAQGGLFDFAAPPSVGGQLIQQLQMLPAGAYRIEGVSAGIDQPDSTRPYWVLRCNASGREVGRVELPNSSENGGRFSGHFVVPSNCPVQVLALIARGSDSMTGLSGQIEHVMLQPKK